MSAPPPPAALLAFEGVSHGWANPDGPPRPVLVDATFALKEGLWHLVGANGAGKSTLLARAAGALAGPGRVRVAGFDLQRQATAARRALAWQPAGAYWPDELTAAQAWAFHSTAKPGLAGGRAALATAFGVVDAGLAHRPLGALSLGQRRKVLLAMVLADPAPVWLLDEPANALDAAALGVLREALARRHAPGAPPALTLVATHDAGLLDGLPGVGCLRLGDGRVVIESEAGERLDGSRVVCLSDPCPGVAHDRTRCG